MTIYLEARTIIYGMLLDIEINSGGSRQKSIRTSTFKLTEQETPSFSELAFFDQNTGIKLTDVRFPIFLQEKPIHIFLLLLRIMIQLVKK